MQKVNNRPGPYLAICILLCAIAAHAQTGPTSKAAGQPSTGAEVLVLARQLYSNEGPRAALPKFEQALELFRKEGDRKGEAITLGLIGNCYKKFGEFPKAEDYLTRALQMKRELKDQVEEAKTLSHLGLLYWEMGEYKSAVEYFTNAINLARQLQDRVIEASSTNNLALVHQEIGDYRLALKEFNTALDLYAAAEKQLGTNPTIERGISDAIGNIGGNHLLLGDYNEALGYYQRSLALDERLNLKSGISLDLQNIGLALTGLGRYPEALQSFDRSIALASEGGLKKEEADSRKGKGSALLQLGRYDEVRNEYRKALAVYEAAGLKQTLIEGLQDLGNLELRLGDAFSAENDFRRALEVAKAINHPRGITYSLLALGDIEWRRKRFEAAVLLYKDAMARAGEAKDRAALATAHLSLAVAYRDLKRFDDSKAEAKTAIELAREVQAVPLETSALYVQAETSRANREFDEALTRFSAAISLVRQTQDPELGWRLQFGRGQVLEALNRNDEALAAYQDAIQTIEKVRSDLREERFRSGYIEDKYHVYIALVQLLLRIGRLEEAFGYAEKLRARSYLDLLNRGQPPIRNESQRRQEITLRNRIRELEQKFEEEAGKPPPDRRGEALDLFSRELANAERDYGNLLDDLLSTSPEYAAVRALKVPSGVEIEQQLPDGTALLEYVLADYSLQVFVLTSNQLRAKSIPIRAADLRNKVEFLRDVLSRSRTNEWKLPAESLYQTLIGPIENEGWLKGIKRIYIVPHAILHYLPFATLVRNSATGPRFLVDDYVLAYLPAAAALVYGNKGAANSKSIMAMAPSSTGLRYTQQESQNVAAFFPNQRMVLLGNRATESSFKRFADQYDVIHLATHGYFNKLNPLLSGVALEADGGEDGRLEVHEILSLRLKAKLVTLSACDTALGTGYFAEVPAGDDLVGLTRAFLFAGSPTVMASLWEVNDLSAVRFMRDFYGQFGASDKATALAQAQRDMRVRGGVYRHPYYWGTFVLIGQMQ